MPAFEQSSLSGRAERASTLKNRCRHRIDAASRSGRGLTPKGPGGPPPAARSPRSSRLPKSAENQTMLKGRANSAWATAQCRTFITHAYGAQLRLIDAACTSIRAMHAKKPSLTLAMARNVTASFGCSKLNLRQPHR